MQPSQPDPARTPAATDESPEMTIARAAATLYGRSCASCHGTDGRGGSGAPPGAQMPDLSAADWHDGNSDEDIAAVIANGRGMMPAFGTQLNERGIAALVQHVRTLRVN